MEVLVAPSQSNEREEETSRSLLQVHLPRPKDGQLQQFLYDEQSLCLYEMTEHFDPHRSWFLDNHCQQRGHLRMLTKLDPLYLFIPQLSTLTATNFRTLDDVCSTFAAQNCPKGSSRLDYALRPDLQWDQICDTQQLEGGELVVRYSESRCLQWLARKHERLIKTLRSELGQASELATLRSYATDLISLYLAPELAQKFKQHQHQQPTGAHSSLKK